MSFDDQAPSLANHQLLLSVKVLSPIELVDCEDEFFFGLFLFSIVPSIMLAIASKLTDPVALSHCINQYCESAFGPESVRTLTNFSQTVDELRIEAVMGTNTVEAQRNGLRRYLGALQLIEDKFPIGQPAKVPFPPPQFVWADSFRPRIKVKGSTARFERACVLFNFAANQSLLARDTDRSVGEGQKVALQLFQASAGIFILLRDQVVPHCVAAGDNIGTDLSDNSLSMCASLMLAQAQALFYEKAVKDKSSRSLLAKLANQASNFYATAYQTAIQLKDHLDPSWVSHAKFQEFLFASAAHFQQAMFDKPNVVAKLSGFGPLVARLRAARDLAHSAESVSVGASVLASIKPLKDAIQAELAAIEYDNQTVYMEMIPTDIKLLAPIGLVPAVKATNVSLSELVDMSYVSPFVDLFENLAPIETKKKMEILDSETAKIVNRVQQCIGEFRVRSIAVPLAPGVVPVPNESVDGDPVSDEMWSKIARIQVIGGALALEGQLATLHGLTGDCEGLVASISRSLDEEERDDKNCRDRFGAARFPRTSSVQLNANLRAQMSNYKQKLQLAIDTNRKVRDRIASQDKSLVGVLGKSRSEIDQLWSEKRLAARKEVVSRGMNPETEALKERCRMAVEKLELFIGEAKKRGEQFSATYGPNSGRLGELMKTKDIDKYCDNLVTEATKESLVLTNELVTSYGSLSAEVENACNLLMSHINDVSPTSGMAAGQYSNANWLQALDTCASIIVQGFSDVSEGVGFFNKLGDYLRRLKAQVDDYCFARNEEKTGILQNIQRGLVGGAAPNDSSPTSTMGQSGYSFGDNHPDASAPPQINFG